MRIVFQKYHKLQKELFSKKVIFTSLVVEGIIVKIMPYILSHIQEAGLFLGLFVVMQQCNLQLINQSSLQKIHYLGKSFNYCLNNLKSKLNIQKSNQKQSEVLEIYFTQLLFSIFKVHYHSFFNLNPALW